MFMAKDGCGRRPIAPVVVRDWGQTPRPVLAPGGAPTKELGRFPITDFDVRVDLTCHVLVVDLKHGIFQ